MIIDESFNRKKRARDAYEDTEFGRYLKKLNTSSDEAFNVPASARLPTNNSERKAYNIAKRNLESEINTTAIEADQVDAELALGNAIDRLEILKENFSIMVNPTKNLKLKQAAQEQLYIQGYNIENEKQARNVKRALFSSDPSSIVTGSGKLPNSVKMRFTLSRENETKDIITSHTNLMAAFIEDMYNLLTNGRKNVMPVPLYENLFNISDSGRITSVKLMSSGVSKPVITKQFVIDTSETSTVAGPLDLDITEEDFIMRHVCDPLVVRIGGKWIQIGRIQNRNTKETYLFTIPDLQMPASTTDDTTNRRLANYKQGEIFLQVTHYPLLTSIRADAPWNVDEKISLAGGLAETLRNIGNSAQYHRKHTPYNFEVDDDDAKDIQKKKYIYINIKPTSSDYEHISLSTPTVFELVEYEIDIPSYVFLNLVGLNGKYDGRNIMNSETIQPIDFNALKLRGYPTLSVKDAAVIPDVVLIYLYSKTIGNLNKYIRTTDRLRQTFLGFSTPGPKSLKSIQKLYKILKKLQTLADKIPQKNLGSVLSAATRVGGNLINTRFRGLEESINYTKNNMIGLLSAFKTIVDNDYVYGMTEAAMLQTVNNLFELVLIRTLPTSNEKGIKLIAQILIENYRALASEITAKREYNFTSTATNIRNDQEAAFLDIVWTGIGELDRENLTLQKQMTELTDELSIVSDVHKSAPTLEMKSEARGRGEQITDSISKLTKRIKRLETTIENASELAQEYTPQNVQKLLQLHIIFADLYNTLIPISGKKDLVDAAADAMLENLDPVRREAKKKKEEQAKQAGSDVNATMMAGETEISDTEASNAAIIAEARKKRSSDVSRIKVDKATERKQLMKRIKLKNIDRKNRNANLI
jgi:hypothetical protein